MKVNVQHIPATKPGEDSPEGAEATPEQSCVWVVGDDGETISTEYLKVGEQVSIEIGATASISTATGEVVPV